MDNELRYPLTGLTSGSMLRVRNGQRCAIVVFEGQVWITQDHDLRDVVLAGGESFAIDHPGLTLVEALADSKLMLVEAQPQGDPLPSSYALQRAARRHRDAALADALRRAVQAVRRAVARVAPGLAPRPMTVCIAGR